MVACGLRNVDTWRGWKRGIANGRHAAEPPTPHTKTPPVNEKRSLTPFWLFSETSLGVNSNNPPVSHYGILFVLVAKFSIFLSLRSSGTFSGEMSAAHSGNLLRAPLPPPSLHISFFHRKSPPNPRSSREYSVPFWRSVVTTTGKIIGHRQPMSDVVNSGSPPLNFATPPFPRNFVASTPE